MRGFIYFVAAPAQGLVKIGYTTNMKERLSALLTGSPVKLDILKVIPGSYVDERGWHRRWAIYRTRGEWFRLEGGASGRN